MRPPPLPAQKPSALEYNQEKEVTFLPEVARNGYHSQTGKQSMKIDENRCTIDDNRCILDDNL